MRGPTHLAIGAGTAAGGMLALRLAGAPIDPVAIGVGSLVAGVGALMPDGDQRGSTASGRMPRKMIAVAFAVAVGLFAVVGFLSWFAGPSAGRTVLSSMGPTLRVIGLVLLAAAAARAAAVVFRILFGHRGPTHSVAFVMGATASALVACSLLTVSAWFAVLFGWGWLTHIAADALTPAGVPYALWPIKAPRS